MHLIRNDAAWPIGDSVVAVLAVTLPWKKQQPGLSFGLRSAVWWATQALRVAPSPTSLSELVTWRCPKAAIGNASAVAVTSQVTRCLRPLLTLNHRRDVSELEQPW